MPQISRRALVLIIQAVDHEISRLENLSDTTITEDEQTRLVAYESLADELEEVYAEAKSGHTNLPDYKDLVTDRGYEEN